MSTHETLGLILVRQGVITRPELYDALRLQRATGQLLGTCLIELGYLTESRLLESLSRQLGAPVCRSEDLAGADATAVTRLSADTARALLAFPIGWTGEGVLRIAIASGAVLSQLRALELETRCAVQPWVALERDISAAIELQYGPLTGDTPLGHALTQRRGSWARPPDAREPPKVLRRAPPAAPASQRIGTPPSEAPLERIGLYIAVEQLYEATSTAEVARWVGRALLNYFARVVVLEAGRVIGHAGVMPQFSRVAPATRALLEELDAPALHYGPVGDIPRAAALAVDLGIGRPPHALIAGSRGGLTHYADNDDRDEPYEDLHDLEMLFKETATALSLLSN